MFIRITGFFAFVVLSAGCSKQYYADALAKKLEREESLLCYEAYMQISWFQPWEVKCGLDQNGMLTIVVQKDWGNISGEPKHRAGAPSVQPVETRNWGSIECTTLVTLTFDEHLFKELDKEGKFIDGIYITLSHTPSRRPFRPEEDPLVWTYQDVKASGTIEPWADNDISLCMAAVDETQPIELKVSAPLRKENGERLGYYGFVSNVFSKEGRYLLYTQALASPTGSGDPLPFNLAVTVETAEK